MAVFALGVLLADQAKLTSYTYKLNELSNILEDKTAKVKSQTTLEDKFNDAVADATDYDKEIKSSFGNKEKGKIWTQQKAEEYGYYKTKGRYNPDVLEELQNEEISLEEQKALFESLVTETQARIESDKKLVQDNSQTYLLQN